MEVLAYNQVKFASVIQNINQELHEKGERCMEMILTIDCDKNILVLHYVAPYKDYSVVSIVIITDYQGLISISYDMVVTCTIYKDNIATCTVFFCVNSSIIIYIYAMATAISLVRCSVSVRNRG